ncbi:MAG: hypothetical protein ABSE19_13610 [Candidatus Acidiferrum sp.]|jgi:hypothetical protein
MGVTQQLKEFAFPASPRGKLQRLLTVSATIVGYFYVWVYQDYLGLRVPLVDVSTLLRLPIIAIVVIPLVFYAYVNPDWLQTGRPKLKSVRFFQAQFPSLYVRDRCGRCAETEKTCKNFIGPASADYTSYWLDGIFPMIKKGNKAQADRTFERGYSCKLIFGLEVVLLFFVVLSLLTIGSKPLVNFVIRRPAPFSLDPKQVIFVVVCLFIPFLMRALNSPDMDSPTGYWHAWREINNAHKLWMKNNEPTLVKVVCHAGGNNTSFSQRP